MSTFENGHSESIIPTFASFVCCVYRYPRITKTMPEEVFDLSSTIYTIYFKKCAAEGKKLPPSRGAFLMHVKRAYVQLKIWSEANLSNINELNYLKYGFELHNNHRRTGAIFFFFFFWGGGAFLVLLEFSPFCLKKSRCDYKKKIKEILPEKLFVLPEFF